jgi:hypothetical protein
LVASEDETGEGDAEGHAYSPALDACCTPAENLRGSGTHSGFWRFEVQKNIDSVIADGIQLRAGHAQDEGTVHYAAAEEALHLFDRAGLGVRGAGKVGLAVGGARCGGAPVEMSTRKSSNRRCGITSKSPSLTMLAEVLLGSKVLGFSNG